MTRSTFLMACNNTGLFNVDFAAKWGIVDYDWSNWKNGQGGWSSTVPMDCDDNLKRQAVSTKERNPDMRVFVYRNMVKALPWYESVRKIITDPQYSGFFLPFKCNASSGGSYAGGCHVPTNGSPLYHDQEQTSHGHCAHNGTNPCCGVPCGEYLFDHRNGSMLQQWFIDSFIGGPNGIDNPAIDGFFFDDNYGSRTGASEEDSHNKEDCGLTTAEANAVSEGWKANTAAVGKAVLAKGGFAVPYFASAGRNETDPKTHCARDLRRLCAVNASTGVPNIHKQALMLEFSRVDHHADIGLWFPNGSLPYFEQDLATFLLVRGPYAWIGYVWSGCTDSGYPGGCDPNCNPTGPADDQGVWRDGDGHTCDKPCRFPKARNAHPFPRPAALDTDYGEPVSVACTESAPGVFEREWTKASVSLDCNTFTADIRLKDE